jgi:(p)ppGpp synthase/HD superfamily hydrolase
MAKRPAGGARLTRRFEQALVYATRAHHKQKRKGTRIPYVGHLLGVAALVLEDGGSQDQAIAALLHDAVEDQGGKARLADIRARFGREVARIVAACSDSETDDPSVEELPNRREVLMIAAASAAGIERREFEIRRTGKQAQLRKQVPQAPYFNRFLSDLPWPRVRKRR